MLDLLAAVSALAHPETAATDSVTVRVAKAVARAAACRRRGDWKQARAFLDVPVVHRRADEQPDALLAEAWLADEPRDPYERCRMARLLARLVCPRYSPGLPLGAAALSPEDQASVVRRAEAWLERCAPGAEGSPTA
ncbi:MAG TPA: hypothetical protein VGK17_00660 [Propionicimonas sp.]|jgi:hypothetical protein